MSRLIARLDRLEAALKPKGQSFAKFDDSNQYDDLRRAGPRYEGLGLPRRAWPQAERHGHDHLVAAAGCLPRAR